MSSPNFKYYLLGDVTPVRVLFNTDGLKIGAEAPDPETGQLVKRPTLLSRIEQSPEVEPIDEGEFLRRCEDIAKKKETDIGQPKLG